MNRARAFGDAFTVGETPGTGPAMNQLLTADERGELNTVFSFDHLENQGKNRYDAYRYNLNHLKRCFIGYEGAYADVAWPSIFVENHDNPRMVSKIDPREEYRLAITKLLAVLLLTARGTVFLYQGQELGAVNVPFTGIGELRDIESLNKYNEMIAAGATPQAAFQTVLNGTRDHARTPMQWTSGRYGGSRTRALVSALAIRTSECERRCRRKLRLEAYQVIACGANIRRWSTARSKLLKKRRKTCSVLSRRRQGGSISKSTLLAPDQAQTARDDAADLFHL